MQAECGVSQAVSLGATREDDDQPLQCKKDTVTEWTAVCVHVCVCVCVCIRACVRVYMCVCICVHVCLDVCVCVCILGCVWVASYPGSQWAGKERAWYPLFVHALTFPEILGNQMLYPNNHDDITYTYRYIVCTFSD